MTAAQAVLLVYIVVAIIVAAGGIRNARFLRRRGMLEQFENDPVVSRFGSFETMSVFLGMLWPLALPYLVKYWRLHRKGRSE